MGNFLKGPLKGSMIKGLRHSKHHDDGKKRVQFTESTQKKKTESEPINIIVREDESKKRKLQDKFEIGRKLGEGSYGKVRLAKSKDTGEEFAVKSILKKNVRRVQTLKREIGIMVKMDHPNIVKLYDIFEDASHIHIVMELCTGGELFDYIVAKQSFSEFEAANLMQQILGAVAYLHDRQIAHRDLKPENFLFKTKNNRSILKLIDFGLSRLYKPNVYMKTRLGTPYYIAPEVLAKQYDQSCDIWSVGVIMYILLCGYPPFWGDTEKQIFERIRRGTFDFPKEEWDLVSSDAKNLITRMLEVDPTKRITARQALDHPWLTVERTKALHPEMLLRLKQFAKLDKFKRCALGVIARMLTEQEIESLRTQFRAIDSDGNGFVTIAELTQAMRAVGLSPSANEVEEVLKTVDVDGMFRIIWSPPLTI